MLVQLEYENNLKQLYFQIGILEMSSQKAHQQHECKQCLCTQMGTSENFNFVGKQDAQI